MISINPAFAMIRQHKKVSEETEALVMKKVRGRITNTELMEVFENGLSGKYGKVYSLDPETLIGWVNKHEGEKNNAKNYLDASLLPISASENEIYNWDKEANKCYQAFLNGVSEEYFHHGIYDRMMLDDKIKLGSYYKYFKGEIESYHDGERKGFLTDESRAEINAAKRKVLRDIFLDYKSQGKTFIYFIQW